MVVEYIYEYEASSVTGDSDDSCREGLSVFLNC